MKIHPILFSKPMIRALLDGRKTQTRRVAKIPSTKPYVEYLLQDFEGGDSPCQQSLIHWFKHGEKQGYFCENFYIKCPYGAVGDLLWVRETWALASRATDIAKIYYKAHENASHTEFHEYVPVEKIGNYQPTWPRYKPSIHMPRWASRITLEITDVRVECLQDISETDAAAEGCVVGKVSGHAFECIAALRLGGSRWANARDWYADLWESINGAGSWDANPWVWVIEFKVHQQNVDEFLKARAA